MPESKRLAELIKSLTIAKSKSAKDNIWNRIETPFVEDCESAERKLVTFLYRLDYEEFDVKPSVYLFSNIKGCLLTDETKLQPIAGTDILYLCLILPSDLRFSYNFAKIDNLTEMVIRHSSNINMNTTSSNYQLIGKFKEACELQSALFEQNKIGIDHNNPRNITYYLDYDNPREYHGMESYVELPLAPSQPYIPENLEIVKANRDALKQEGRLREYLLQFNETSLKGIADYQGETSTRKYWVYLPKEYVHNVEKPYPMILFLDGSDYLNQIPTPIILDKMVKEGVIPPTIAVYLEYSNIYRAKEYDCNDVFTHFISNGFIELLRNKHQLPITNDSRFITIAGSSMSGLAAFYAGLTYPSIFGNVIAQSPSFESKEMKKFKKLIGSHIGNCKNSIFSIEVGNYETLPVDLQFYDREKTLQSYSSLEANKLIIDHMSRHGVNISLHQFTGAHSALCWRGTISKRIKEIFDIRLRECSPSTRLRK